MIERLQITELNPRAVSAWEQRGMQGKLSEHFFAKTLPKGKR